MTADMSTSEVMWLNGDIASLAGFTDGEGIFPSSTVSGTRTPRTC
jgi:hypothetical protein